VTEVVRLTLVAHAMTDAMAAGRFPVDEPLNGIGRRQVKKAGRLDVRRDTRQLTGPEQRARETAQLMGLRAATEPRGAGTRCGPSAPRTSRRG
jgi:broad specificity phosphatase PhoE